MRTGVWERGAIADRLARVLSTDGPDPSRLAMSLCSRFGEGTPPDVKTLAKFFLTEPLLAPAFQSEEIRALLLDSPVMLPGLASISALPELPAVRDIGLWLCLFDNELSWFADTRFRQEKVTDEKLHHYRYSWIPKRTGGYRLIEKPKFRMKEIQRTILKDILNQIPPHVCSHGFTQGRSIKTYAEPHTGQNAVLRFDLKDFFHSVPLARISALFRRLGYPPPVAHILQGLCTSAVSPSLAGAPFSKLSWLERKRLQGKHLPQGAPTSPQMANLCAWRLDCRLKGLADRYGYHYTRYADDLALSGDASLARRSDFIEALVGAIAIEEGFSLNHRKTRLRLASQRQYLTGIVVNQKTNYSRKDWEQLKATLYNCAKHGPESQNRGKHPDLKAYLEGHVAHATWLNPARGKKLQSLLNKIVW